MLISIDSASERPIYAQIADAVRRSVAAGETRPGERLPPAGDIAEGLGVHKHTVLRAYQDLRDEGLIDLRRGRGAVVTGLARELVALRAEATRIAERARRLGVSRQTLAALFDEEQPSLVTPTERGPDQTLSHVGVHVDSTSDDGSSPRPKPNPREGAVAR